MVELASEINSNQDKMKKLRFEIYSILRHLRRVQKEDLEKHIIEVLSGKRKMHAGIFDLYLLSHVSIKRSTVVDQIICCAIAGLISSQTVYALSEMRKFGLTNDVSSTVAGEVESEYRKLLVKQLNM